MNPALLLAHFERLADAPDTIPRLRRFILKLGVRGRLILQDLNDEPASELLKRVGKLPPPARYSKRSVELIPGDCGLSINEPDLPVPSGWIWVPLVQVARIESGHTPSRNRPDWWHGDVPWMGLVDARAHNNGRIFDTIQHTNEAWLANSAARLLPEGTVCFSRTASVGYVVIMGRPMATSQDFVNWVPTEAISSEWLQLVMIAERSAIPRFSKGAVHQTIYYPAWLSMYVALPPLAEQHRIVAKVNELMALCDRLEAARNERESRRDRLVAASLHRLSQPSEADDADAFRANARFYFNHLPRLTTRPDHIKQLRQTIFNLAVRGRLVPQEPADEPASELLKRIAAEKARLVKAGEIRREKPLPALSNTDRPYELPYGWEWVRLGTISKLVTSGSRDWAKHYSSEGAIFVRMGNLSKGHYRLRLDHIQCVSPPAGGEGTRTRLEGGDILISITGDVGMLGLIPEDFGEAYINQHTAMVRPMPEMKGRYLAELFRSPFAQDQFNEPQRGIKNSFRLTDVTEFVLPLPPLADQRRIVAKIDELMALCDRLEANLVETEADSRRLLEAVLHEALQPAESALEAAE